jgi:hypothetical protein
MPAEAAGSHLPRCLALRLPNAIIPRAAQRVDLRVWRVPQAGGKPCQQPGRASNTLRPRSTSPPVLLSVDNDAVLQNLLQEQ